MHASTPYYAVIFTTKRSAHLDGYAEMARAMEELAAKQDGFLGIEGAYQEIGITVSYWSSLESIRNWKQQADHLVAQKQGREQWYTYYKVRVCKVEREYAFGEKPDELF